MTKDTSFDLRDFLPYLLNQAAAVTSRDFEPAYKAKYGMLRTEWRVVFHLGRYGKMTATDICTRARMHKTKVSRAVAALETKRYLSRTAREDDRRHETLALTAAGGRVYADLLTEAQQFDAKLTASFSAEEAAILRQVLMRLAAL